MHSPMLRYLSFVAALIAPVLAWAGATQPPALYPNAANAVLPAARDNLGLRSLSVTTYAGVDPTGATDSSTGIGNAATDACNASPIRSLIFPPGTYKIAHKLTIPAGCDGFTIWMDPAAEILRDPANNDSPWFLSHSKQSNITIWPGIIDGNYLAGFTSLGTTAMVFNGPAAHVHLWGGVCRNTPNTCAQFGGQGGLSGTTTGTAANGQAALTLTGSVTGLNPGAFFIDSGGFTDPGMYLATVSGANLTLNTNLTDTILTGNLLRFTNSFQTSADALGGATVFSTTSTTNLSVGQSVAFGNATNNSCLVSNAKISSIVTDTSVTIDTPLLCKISSGAWIAAIGGFQDYGWDNATFDTIGMGLRNLGTLTLTTATDTPSGSTITFNCVSGSNCTQVGLIPNDKSTSSAQGGMPANNLVVDGPTVNAGPNTFSVTFQNVVTQDIPQGTSLTFAVGAPSGNGYGIQALFGSNFANDSPHFLNNYYRHTWSAPLNVTRTKHLRVSGVADEDWMEAKFANGAASPCLAISYTVDTDILSFICNGATGQGFEGNHNSRLQIDNFTAKGVGQAGIFECGGSDIIIGDNVHVYNNGAVLNYPALQTLTISAGINLEGSCTTSQAGTLSRFSIGSVDASDTQSTPTQKYGLQQQNNSATITGTVSPGVNASGNVTAPTLGSALAIPVIPSSGTPTALTAGGTGQSAASAQALAYALKLPFVLHQSGAPTTNTALATTEINHASVTYPALGANDALRITLLWNTTGTATDTKNIILRLGTTGCTSLQACSSGGQALNVNLNTVGLVSASCQIIIRNANATNAQVVSAAGNSACGVGSAGSAISTVSTQTNAGGFLNMDSITLTSSADSIVLEGYTVELLPSN